MASHPLDVFRQRLVEAIVWCSKRATLSDVRTGLRTPVLHPARDTSAYRYGLLDNGVSVVSRLAEQRRNLLHNEGESLSTSRTHLMRGRLLVYQPDASFADSLADDQTGGFFDRWDAPPWDTWAWYEKYGSISALGTNVAEGYLISWIPPEFERLAQEGIDVHPFGAIAWASHVDTPFINTLRAEGLGPVNL